MPIYKSTLAPFLFFPKRFRTEYTIAKVMIITRIVFGTDICLHKYLSQRLAQEHHYRKMESVQNK